MEESTKKDSLWIGYYLVAFVYILNQKQDFIKKLKKTFGVVDGFRKTFENFYKANSEPSAAAQLVAKEHRQAFNEMQKSGIKFQRFADTFITYLALRTNGIKAPITGVFAALGASASTFLVSLAAEQVCRGGIEIGLAGEIQEGEIYGHALYEAYHLESEVAHYPRIVVGEGLIN